MNRTIQKLFAWSLILLFFIIAPAIALYSMGYRLTRDDNDAPTLVSTGGIRINTKIPYEITINDKMESKSPLLKVGLEPQDLNVILSLPGYQPWGKKISIQPSFVQLISDVTLFPEEPSLEQFSDLRTARNIRRIPNTSLVLYTSYNPNESGLWTLDLDTNIRKRITNSVTLGGVDNQDYFDFVWSDSGNTLSFRTSINNEMRYIVATNIDTNPVLTTLNSLAPIPDITNNPISIVSLAADRVFFTQAGSLYEINPPFNSISNALVSDIISSDFINQTLYYTSSRDIGNIRVYSLDTKKNASIPLPDIRVKKIFISPNESHLIIIDDKQHAWLKALGENTADFNKIADLNIIGIEFANDSKKALLISNNSLSMLYLDTIEGYKSRIEGDFDTLYTSKSTLSYAELWEPNSEYIIFLEDNTLKAVESDTRGSINSYTLAKNITQFASMRIRNDARTAVIDDNNIIQSFTFPIRRPLININN